MLHSRRRGGTILIVEDTPVLRGMLVAYFEQRGYLVFGAADPVTAYQLAQQVPPDVVLTDADLRAETTGASLALRLRAMTPDVKLVLMTGNHASAGPEVDLFDCVLEKPFRLSAASAVIRCLLQGQ